MPGVLSYTYKASAVTTARNGSATTDEFVGRVVAPDRVSYQAKVGRRSFEIVRIGPASYRRDPGGPWHKLPAGKGQPSAPNTVLLAVLQRLTGVKTSAEGLVTGTLSAQDAHGAGLASGPGIASPVAVALRVDPLGHVLHFEATIKVKDAHTDATLKTQTDFADYDAASGISAPL
jgi:hypothetical protein